MAALSQSWYLAGSRSGLGSKQGWSLSTSVPTDERAVEFNRAGLTNSIGNLDCTRVAKIDGAKMNNMIGVLSTASLDSMMI